MLSHNETIEKMLGHSPEPLSLVTEDLLSCVTEVLPDGCSGVNVVTLTLTSMGEAALEGVASQNAHLLPTDLTDCPMPNIIEVQNSERKWTQACKQWRV